MGSRANAPGAAPGAPRILASRSRRRERPNMLRARPHERSAGGVVMPKRRGARKARLVSRTAARSAQRVGSGPERGQRRGRGHGRAALAPSLSESVASGFGMQHAESRRPWKAGASAGRAVFLPLRRPARATPTARPRRGPAGPSPRPVWRGAEASAARGRPPSPLPGSRCSGTCPNRRTPWRRRAGVRARNA